MVQSYILPEDQTYVTGMATKQTGWSAFSGFPTRNLNPGLLGGLFIHLPKFG